MQRHSHSDFTGQEPREQQVLGAAGGAGEKGVEEAIQPAVLFSEHRQERLSCLTIRAQAKSISETLCQRGVRLSEALT